MNESILNNMEYDPEKGAILYKNVRYMFVRPETVMEIFNQLGDTAKTAFHKAGYTGGKLSAAKFKAVMQLDDHQIVNFMADMGTQIGWGKFTVVEFNPSTQLLVMEVESSPFAQVLSSATEPVCHMILGVLSGLCAGIFKKDIHGVEEKCMAKGDPTCVFKISG